jgi:two-component sensor histidine kinase
VPPEVGVQDVYRFEDHSVLLRIERDRRGADTENMDERQITLDLSADTKAPGNARRSLEELRRHMDPETAESISLLVNELVTNSVKFAGRGSIEVRLARTEGGESVRVEVLDDGPGFVPTSPEPALTDTSGRGLFLVDAIADRWGVSMDGRTCVWFEIDALGSDRTRE